MWYITTWEGVLELVLCRLPAAAQCPHHGGCVAQTLLHGGEVLSHAGLDPHVVQP